MKFAGKFTLSDEAPTLLVPDSRTPFNKSRAKAKWQTELGCRSIR